MICKIYQKINKINGNNKLKMFNNNLKMICKKLA